MWIFKVTEVYSENDHMLWVFKPVYPTNALCFFFSRLPWFTTRQNILKHSAPIYVKDTTDTETSCQIFRDQPEQVISGFAITRNVT